MQYWIVDVFLDNGNAPRTLKIFPLWSRWTCFVWPVCFLSWSCPFVSAECLVLAVSFTLTIQVNTGQNPNSETDCIYFIFCWTHLIQNVNTVVFIILFVLWAGVDNACILMFTFQLKRYDWYQLVLFVFCDNIVGGISWIVCVVYNGFVPTDIVLLFLLFFYYFIFYNRSWLFLLLVVNRHKLLKIIINA